MLKNYENHHPQIHSTAYISENAVVIGQVQLAADVSLWPGCVLRGDVEAIIVQEGSNLQDGVLVHTSYDLPVLIGRGVTVGHGAILHGCSIGDNCLIGMGAILLDGVRIGENCIVGAGAVLPEKMEIPPGHLVLGTPGRILRTVTPDEMRKISRNAEEYREFARLYRTAHHRDGAHHR